MKNMLSSCAMVMVLCCTAQFAVAQEISSLILINAKENSEIGVLSEGDSIDIAELNTNEFSVRADVSGQVGSILFELDDEEVGADNRVPYALLGNPGNNYRSWIPELRTYKITASAYSLRQGQGDLLDSRSVSVTFVDGTEINPPGPMVEALVLVNADTDEDIAEITEGSVFVLDEIGTHNLNIRAETGEGTESVVFGYQDSTAYHTENLPEYAIGANDGDDYRPWNPDIGLNRVTATAFDQNKGRGNAGDPLTVEFAILEENSYEPPAFELRINSGGETVVHNDTIYMADTLFFGQGRPFSNYKIADILGTDNDSLYKTERTTTGRLRSFAYKIPVEEGEYEVRLHFAEIYWGAAGGGQGGTGKRVFNVSIEGENVIADYDLSSEKDPMTAIVKTFKTEVSDGELTIDFGATVDQPKVSAIEIYGVAAPGESIDFCDWEMLSNPSEALAQARGVKVNDTLYLLGVRSDSAATRTMEVYDPEADVWSTGVPVPNPISGAAMVGIGDEIWLLGGIGQDSTRLASNRVHIYDTANDIWQEGPPLPEARSAGAVVHSEGKVHFFGGLMPDGVTGASNHYILDLNDSLARWQIAASLPEPRSHMGAIGLNGKIYAIGGRQPQDSIVKTVSYLDEYDPLANNWSRKADLPMPLSDNASAVVGYDDKIIVGGGHDGDSFVSALAEYDPQTDSWSERCLLPEGFVNPSVAIFGSRMLVVNGEGNETVSLALEAEVEVPDEKEGEIGVLVYHETAGFRHRSIEAGIEMVREFGDELGWTVRASQTSDLFQVDSLAMYDVVIWLNTTGDDLLTAEEQRAFEGFIQNGGGFVGIHSATDTYRNGSWPWYNDLVGAIVQVSPYHTKNNTNATIDVVGEHSAVEHLGTEWNKNEEYYYWERNGGYLFGGNIDLLRVRSTGSNSYDAARPVTWYKEYDGGRSFYTALGHNAADYESNEKFRTLVKEAILWAAEGKEPISEEPEEGPVSEEPTEEEVLEPVVNEDIELFPNPVVDLLTVNTDLLTEGVVGEIAIFGLDGNLMKQKTISVHDNQIDLGELPSAYYIALVQIGTVSDRKLVYKQM